MYISLNILVWSVELEVFKLLVQPNRFNWPSYNMWNFNIVEDAHKYLNFYICLPSHDDWISCSFFPNHRNQQICLHNLIIRLKFIFIVSKKIFLTLWLNPFVSGSQHIESDSQINKENKSESCIDNSLKFRNFKFNRNKFYLTIFTTLCAFLGIVLLIVLSIRSNELHKQSTTGDGDDSRKNIAINSTIGYDALSCCTKWLTVTFAFFPGSDLLLSKVLRLVSRDEWLAQPPNDDLADLVLPAKRFIITHTATEPCDAQVRLKVNKVRKVSKNFILLVCLHIESSTDSNLSHGE